MDIKEGKDILDCELPDVDVVIHLAGISGVINSIEKPTETVKNNVLGTVRLIEKYKDTRFIFASSGGAIQDEILSPYGLSKKHCEDYIKMLCSNYAILRFANVYGKEGSRSVVDKFLKEDITIYGEGDATRTYLYIDDLIKGIIMAIEWEKGEYYFGGGGDYTVKEIAEAVGKPIKYAPFREGELLHSSLKNTTQNWLPIKNLMEYICSYQY